MNFKFKLSLPLGKDGRVIAETGCGPSSAEWRERLSELAIQTGDAAAEKSPREVLAHPARLDSALVDDFMGKL